MKCMYCEERIAGTPEDKSTGVCKACKLSALLAIKHFQRYMLATKRANRDGGYMQVDR